MASAKIVEGEKPYTGGTAIEITANKVINLLLREANNLIKVNDNNEVYTDLQMQANTQFVLENIEVGATVGRVSSADGRQFTGTILAYKTASGTVNMWGYSDEGDLFFFNGSSWVGFYTKDQVDGIIAQVRAEMAQLAEELRKSISDLRDELYVVREELIGRIPTKNSQLENDSGFITVAVTGLENYYDKTTIDNFLNEKANKTDVADGLATKVDKDTTYEMTNLNMDEQGVISETFSNQKLTETLQIVKNALSTLYDGKASAAATTAALNRKADIEYVDNLVGSTLGVTNKVVDTLPVTGQGNYIYMVPVPGEEGNYEKFVWNAETSSYVSLGYTTVDLSNMVTIDGNQEITGVKTFTNDIVLPANTADATNNNTKAARESQVYQVSQNVAALETSVANTYATVQALESGLSEVSGDIGAGNITVQINGSTTGVTNPTFNVNQANPSTVSLSINKTTVGLGNVDNTSDVNKPVSTAQAEAIAGAVSAFAETVDEELAGKQATLVSGTNIKTINSTSLLGSGNIAVQPTLVSGTNIKTVNGTSLLGSGNIQAGNTTHSIITVTLTASGWTDSEQSVTATGVTASNGVLVSPAPDSIADYATAMIYCTTQASNKLTFSCSTAPENDITVNVMIIS